MRAPLAFASLVMLMSSVAAAERGIVGLGVDAAPDFRVITSVVPDSPAARAGVQVGDRILAIDGHPTSQLHSAQELVGRAAGAPDTQVELQLQRAGAAQPLRVRMRRVIAPPTTPSPTPIPDPSGYQASSHANGLTSVSGKFKARRRFLTLQPGVAPRIVTATFRSRTVCGSEVLTLIVPHKQSEQRNPDKNAREHEIVPSYFVNEDARCRENDGNRKRFHDGKF